MKEKNKAKEYTTLPVKYTLKRKLIIERAKYGFDDWESFFSAIIKILKDFKPEIKEMKK